MVIFAGVPVIGAVVAGGGAAMAGAWLAPLLGRAGGWGWLWALGAAVAITALGGAAAGALLDPTFRFGGPLAGVLFGFAMSFGRPVTALVWLGGFAGLHLGLQHWRGLQLARERLRVFAD